MATRVGGGVEGGGVAGWRASQREVLVLWVFCLFVCFLFLFFCIMICFILLFVVIPVWCCIYFLFPQSSIQKLSHRYSGVLLTLHSKVDISGHSSRWYLPNDNGKPRDRKGVECWVKGTYLGLWGGSYQGHGICS